VPVRIYRSSRDGSIAIETDRSLGDPYRYHRVSASRFRGGSDGPLETYVDSLCGYLKAGVIESGGEWVEHMLVRTDDPGMDPDSSTTIRELEAERGEDLRLRDALITCLGEVRDAAAMPSARLEELPGFVRGLRERHDAYRTLGVDRVTAGSEGFYADVAQMLSRPVDVDPDVLLSDLHGLTVGQRAALAGIHYPRGWLCVVCDDAPYGDGVNNPACTHHQRTCNACRNEDWPCATAALMQIDDWHDPDSIAECGGGPGTQAARIASAREHYDTHSTVEEMINGQEIMSEEEEAALEEAGVDLTADPPEGEAEAGARSNLLTGHSEALRVAIAQANAERDAELDALEAAAARFADRGAFWKAAAAAIVKAVEAERGF
jgi:hypothetical protein